MIAFPKPKQMKRGKKSRMVDGHEAVKNTTAKWKDVRREVIVRSGGICECGCGQMFLSAGLVLHHWKGRTRGNRCDCAFHLQGLTPVCHEAAHKHRLGQPFKRAAGGEVGA